MNLPLETILYSALALTLILTIGLLIRLRRKKPSRPKANTQAIIRALGIDNILDVSFKRDKVNVQVKDYRQTDLNALKEAGCVGINVVGDTIKYYLEEDNENHYKALLADLERK